MTDILDYVLKIWLEKPDAPPEQVVDSVRREFGGDTIYVRVPRLRETAGNTQDIARRCGVSRRTAQRWKRA